MERSEIEKTVTGIVCEQLGVAESEVNTDSVSYTHLRAHET